MSKVNVSFGALLMAVSLALATQVPVSIVEFAFAPDTVRINAGDSVIWTNNGTFLHTSTSGAPGVWDSLWDSGDLGHGAAFAHGFPVDGTFRYFCRHHYLSGMTGVVVVGASGVSEGPGPIEDAPRIAGFPNPFGTTITLRLLPTRGGRGSVRLFDASGKLVRTFWPAAGTSVVWDGTDNRGQEIGPGVYFCRYGSGALAVTRLR